MAKVKFEDQMKKLQEIVDKLESGEEDMDEAIKLYEEGLKISKELEKQLKGFEDRINEIGKDSND